MNVQKVSLAAAFLVCILGSIAAVEGVFTDFLLKKKIAVERAIKRAKPINKGLMSLFFSESGTSGGKFDGVLDIELERFFIKKIFKSPSKYFNFFEDVLSYKKSVPRHPLSIFAA